ncbi:FkbM family methyltransferase [Streptomyces sp. NPDC005146]
MLDTTRASFGFRDHPLSSLRNLVRSRLRSRQIQVVRLPDGVVLHADAGHPNRCYAWTGERSWGVAAALGALLRPGCVFLDVGAFTGQHSMRAAHTVGVAGRVAAVEPDPRVLPWLRRNLRAAGLESRVRVLEAAAVPDGREVVDLSLSPHISMAFVDLNEHPARARVKAIDIVTLARELRPDVVKIDVEGLDAELVRRLCSVVPDPPVLVVENNAGVTEAAAASGLQVVPVRSLLSPADAALTNVSDDVIAFPPGRVDVQQLAGRFAEEASRLRVRPDVSFQSVAGAP